MSASIAGGIRAGFPSFGARISQASVCVDVVGQPAVNVVDFFGQTGANYVTGGAGNYFTLEDQAGNLYSFWFAPGVETAPPGAPNPIEVTISPTASPSDIAAALQALGSTEGSTAVVINGGGTNSAVQFTLQANKNAVIADVNTGAAFSQTQLGFPSAHICSPTSDALAGISFARRFQRTFLGVGYNASLGGKPAYTTNLPNGSPALFQNASRTIPAVSQGDTVMSMIDPSGNTATQTNSMNALTLNFIQGANGMYYPTLMGSGNGFFAIDTPFYPGANWVGFHGFNRSSSGSDFAGFANSLGYGPYDIVSYQSLIYVFNLTSNDYGSDSGTGWNDWVTTNSSNVISMTKNGSNFPLITTSNAISGSFSELYADNAIAILNGQSAYDAITSAALSGPNLSLCAAYFASLHP